MVANWFYMPSLFVIQNIFSPIRIIEQTRFLEKGLRRASKQRTGRIGVSRFNSWPEDD